MLTSRHLFAVGKFPKPAMPDWFVCFYGWHVTGENVFFFCSLWLRFHIWLSIGQSLTFCAPPNGNLLLSIMTTISCIDVRPVPADLSDQSAQWPTEGRRDVMAFVRCFVVRNVSSYADFAYCSAGMIQFALLVEFGPYASLAGDNRSVLSTWREIR